MDTREIDKVLNEDHFTRHLYGGTCALVKISHTKDKAVCYIINTAPSWHPGTHWIAIFKLASKNEYFCSYGSSPQPELLPLLGKTYLSNSWTLQDFRSDLCGQYCILFLLCRCRGYSLSNFLHCFSSNSILNDKLVADVFQKYISNKCM